MRRFPHRTHLKPGLLPGFFFCLAVAACEPPPPAQGNGARVPVRFSVAARIEDGGLDEISGIARSLRNPGILWVHNDSGDKAHLYAVDTAGRSRGRVTLDSADNVDWEDLDAFERDGRAYLLVADIGDNDARRDFLTLYGVPEPELGAGAMVTVAPEWRLRFRYPDGPRDAEAAVVDVAGAQVLVLSKRDLPPVLYAMPLDADGEEPVLATRLGPVASLPLPSHAEIEIAPFAKDWYWQPTAMTISPAGDALVILTYGALYYYRRDGHPDWASALAALPLRFDLRKIPDAEAVTFGADGRTLFVSVEEKHAPLLRIELEPGPAKPQ